MGRSIMIVGRDSYIGGELLLRGLGNAGNVIGTTRTGVQGSVTFDLALPDAFDYGAIRGGDVFLILAGISSPDTCRLDPVRAWSVNVEGTVRFIRGVLGRGGKVLFFSSDTVYGETEIPVDEQSPVRPGEPYARMKFAVEKEFLGERRFKSLRLSYVFSRRDRFTRKARECHAATSALEVYHPLRRSIVHAGDVADTVIALIEAWDGFPHPVINAAGPALLSRMDLAGILRDRVFPGMEIRAIEPGEAFYFSRPRTIHMVSRYFEGLLGRHPRTIEDAVAMEFTVERSGKG